MLNRIRSRIYLILLVVVWFKLSAQQFISCHDIPKIIPYSLCLIFYFIFYYPAPSLSPSKITVNWIKSRGLGLSWSHPEADSINGVAKNYVISIKEMALGKIVTVLVGSKSSAYNLTGLLPYKNYSLGIAVMNSAGTGPFSLPIQIRTKEEGSRCQIFSFFSIFFHLFSFFLIFFHFFPFFFIFFHFFSSFFIFFSFLFYFYSCFPFLFIYFFLIRSLVQLVIYA